MEEFKHIGIIKKDIKPLKAEAHPVLIQKLTNADTQFLKRILFNFNISRTKELKRLLKFVIEEVNRCRTYPRRMI